VKDYDLDQPMDRLIDIAVSKFGAVEFQKVTVGDVTLDVLQVKDMQRYIDTLVNKTRAGKTISLPLWAKVWPSCLILGYMLTRFPFPEGCRILEVGAGGAVNGLVLAKRGLPVTVSDIDPDALLFSRINVLKNGLGEFATVTRLDFTRDRDQTPFDCIVGCEVLYDEMTYEPMARFLDEQLAMDAAAEVFLALDEKRQARKFFTLAAEKFSMAKTSSKYNDQGSGEERTVNLFRLKRKVA
jgi:2-polyprenyl-3-methyl-5-hydroxy-6-metoxy-1,4-benzoquinol methylase